MMHADEGTLQALLDGELDAARRAAVEHHLAGCGACAADLDALRALRDRFRFALRAGDAPAAVEPARAAVAARSRTGGGAMRQARRALARAAVLVVGAAGIAFAAVPGSPVRRWIGVDGAPAPVVPEPGLRPAPAAPAAAPDPGDDDATAAAVSIHPAGGGVRVVLSAASPGVQVRARFTDQPMAHVQARGEAAGARFRTGPGRVEVVGAGPGEVRVELPRGVETAVLEVNGRVYLAREGESTRVLGPVEAQDSAGVLFAVSP